MSTPKLTVPDAAIEVAAKAVFDALPGIEGCDPDELEAWDDISPEDLAKFQAAVRVGIEAALPLLKYEASS